MKHRRDEFRKRKLDATVYALPALGRFRLSETGIRVRGEELGKRSLGVGIGIIDCKTCCEIVATMKTKLGRG